MKTGVIIVGAGIAGLTLSHFLQGQGVAHVVLARRGHPPALALAETLPPSGVAYLQQLGLLDLFAGCAIGQTHGYHAIWGQARVLDSNFFSHRPFQYGLKLDKQAILDALAQWQAQHMQAYEGQLQVHCLDDAVAIDFVQDGQRRTLSAQLMVDASGRNRALLRQLGIAAEEFDRLLAFSCHLPRFRHPALTHSVFVETFPDGWGIVSGLNGQQNVMTLYSDQRHDLLRQYPNWAAMLVGTRYLRDFLTGDDSTRVTGARASSSRAQALAGARWLAIGDAAISFDPLSSHGISNALYTARQAATAIERYLNQHDALAFPAYADTLSAIFRQYLHGKDLHYCNECRWPQAPFWRGRHAGSAVAA